MLNPKKYGVTSEILQRKNILVESTQN